MVRLIVSLAWSCCKILPVQILAPPISQIIAMIPWRNWLITGLITLAVVLLVLWLRWSKSFPHGSHFLINPVINQLHQGILLVLWLRWSKKITFFLINQFVISIIAHSVVAGWTETNAPLDMCRRSWASTVSESGASTTFRPAMQVCWSDQWSEWPTNPPDHPPQHCETTSTWSSISTLSTTNWPHGKNGNSR